VFECSTISGQAELVRAVTGTHIDHGPDVEGEMMEGEI
jgi:hypothetical protein